MVFATHIICCVNSFKKSSHQLLATVVRSVQFCVEARYLIGRAIFDVKNYYLPCAQFEQLFMLKQFSSF